MHRAAVASTSAALRTAALPGPSAGRLAGSNMVASASAAATTRHISHVARPRQSPRPILRASASTSPFAASSSPSRTFATSSPRRSAGGTKSPFQAFVDTLKEELAKSQAMQENVRQLQGEAGKMQDSETMKKMREAYERARIITSIKENPRLQKAADALRKSGGQVGDAVGATLKQMEDSELIKGLGAISSSLARQLADSTAPVRNTEAYKALSQTLVDAFDDGGSALRIYTDAELDARQARRIKREARLKKIGRRPPLKDVESDEAIAVIMMAGKDPADLVNEDPMAAAAMAAEAEAKAAAAAGQAQAEGAEGAAEDGAAKPKAEGEADGEATEGEKPKPAPKPKAAPPRPPVAGFAARTRGVKENSEAGEALVLKEEPKYKQAWASFRERSPLARRMAEWREAYDESENPVVERIRGITETIGGWFQENETAQVVGAMRMMDPSFTLDGFQKELREYVVPEIIDAYHGAARHLLKQWCGEATYNVLLATIDPFLQKGLTAHGRLLDVRNIDILQARMLENNVPVLVVSFSSQELMYFKDPKTGEVKAGREDQADLCRYAMVLTRVEEEMDNEITGGWKVVELARRGQAAFL